jgi:hypothetical protein
MQFFDEVQALLNDDFMDGINSDEEEDIEWDHVKNMDIWDDQQTMVVLNRGQILVECNLQENTRIKNSTLHYHWNHDKLMFKDLCVPTPNEHKQLILDPQKEIGHFGKGHTLVKVNKQYFWHNKIKDVWNVVHACKQCQMVKQINNIRSYIKEMNIHVWDQFYKVTLDIIGPLPKTNNGHKYILVAIDHYCKWVEAKVVVEHEAQIVANFLENEIIYRFGVPRYVLINNGGEWAVEFDQLCKNYGITHSIYDTSTA